MIGIITRIDESKVSRNRDVAFTRLSFSMFQKDGKRTYAKTDLVQTFRNFKRWKPLLTVGNVLDGLKMKGENTVDADSFPTLLRTEKPPAPPLTQTKLFGDYPLTTGK